MTQQLMIKSTSAAWYIQENANQLLYSTDITTGDVWFGENVTITPGVLDPTGGTDGFKLTATQDDATFRQLITLQGGSLNRVLSVYTKQVTGVGDIQLTVDGVNWETVNVTPTYAQVYKAAVVGNSTISVGIRIRTNGDAIWVAFFQYEDGVTPSDYAANEDNRYAKYQVLDADYPANTVRGCVFFDGRFFVMTPEGVIQHSALEDASSWNALDFIQSQNDPSSGVFLSKSNNYIVAFKEWSIEFFYDAANPVGSILSPVQNAAIQLGCASDGSVQDLGSGLLVFMGHTRNGFGRSIFTLNGTTPQKISTLAIDKFLDKDDLSTVYSWVAQVGSHTLYAVTLVNTEKTLVYDFSTQLWSLFSYLVTSSTTGVISAITAAGVVTSATHGLSDGDIVSITNTSAEFDGWHVVTDVTTNTFQIQATGSAFSGSGAWELFTETYFPVSSSVSANGRQYMQDISNGSVYEFSMGVYADAVGAIAARIRTPKLDGGVSVPKFMSTAEVIGNKIESTVLLRYSDDDYQTYSTYRPIDLSANRSRVRRLGKYNRRAFELLHVKDALLRLEALDVDE